MQSKVYSEVVASSASQPSEPSLSPPKPPKATPQKRHPLSKYHSFSNQTSQYAQNISPRAYHNPSLNHNNECKISSPFPLPLLPSRTKLTSSLVHANQPAAHAARPVRRPKAKPLHVIHQPFPNSTSRKPEQSTDRTGNTIVSTTKSSSA
jgi:hypothetical protein